MNVGQYVNSPYFGLGKVHKVHSSGNVDVLFFNHKGIKTLKTDSIFLQVVPEGIINKIKNNQPETIFDSWTRKKGEEYENQINNVEFADNSFKVNIKGTRIYKNNILFNNNGTISFNCSCPVNGKCKHSSAFYRFLFNQLLKDDTLLVDDYNNVTNKKFDEHVNNFLSSFFKIESFKLLKDDITNTSESDINNYINFLIRLDFDAEYIMFVISMIAKYSYIPSRTIKKIIKNAKKPKIEYEFDTWTSKTYYSQSVMDIINSALTFLEKEEYYFFIKSMLDNNPYLHSNIYYILVDFAFLKLTQEEKNRIFYFLTKQKLLTEDETYEILNKYYDQDSAIMNRAIKFRRTQNSSMTFIKDLSVESFFKIEDKISSADLKFYYAKNKLMEMAKYDKVKTVSCILSLSQSHQSNILNNVEELLKKIDVNEETLNIAYELCDSYSFFSTRRLTDNEIDESKSKVLWDYFLATYSITQLRETIYLSYYLYLPNKLIILEINTVISEGKVIKRDNSNSYLYDSIGNKVIEGIVDENFNKEFNNALKAAEDYVIELRQEKLILQLESFVEENRKLEIGTLNDNCKVDFQCELDLKNEYFDLYFKVGINKFYIVKNASTFLENFKHNTFVKYGKELAFYHNVNNLTSSACKLYSLMCREGTVISYYQKNAIRFEYDSLSALLNILVNKVVLINGNNYLISLNERNLSIEINSSYTIKLIGLNDNEALVFTDENVYIINDNNNQIEHVDTTNLNIPFLKLVNELNGLSLKRQKDYFVNNIYAKFKEQINVDEKIQEDFKLSILEISSYFDYVNKKITVNSKYHKNDVELKEMDIKDYNDLLLKNKYEALLAELGFKEKIMENDDDIYHFFSMDFSDFKKTSKVFLSDSIMNKQLTSFVEPKLRVSYNNQMMSVFLDDSLYSDDQLYAILKAIKNKKKYYILNNDTIVDLNNNEAKEFYNLVTDLKLNEKKLNEVVEKPLYQSFKLLNYSKEVSFDNYIKKMINDIANYKNANFDIPKLNATYRQYQIEGYLWLKTLASYNLGGILADDMGLGKTLEIIMLLNSDSTSRPSLIVCPKSLIFNWKSEFLKFDGSSKVVEIYGNSSVRTSIISKIKKDEKVIYITSYDSLRNDDEEYKNTFEYLIIDEGQYIKNSQAQKSQVVKKIKANHRFALTGTPVENNIYDLWSIFDFLMPNYLESLDKFKEKYNLDENYTALVAKKVSPFILRRTKKEVLKDLPSKYERIVTAEMNQQQRMVYDAHCLQAKDILNSGGKSFDVLYLLTRLRQICVDPATFIENYNHGSGKIETLLSLVDEYLQNNHKILIFSQFVKALNIVSDNLDKKGINYYKLTGDTSGEERLRLCNQFNNNSDVNIFLISLKAGGTGLNLIGADTIIHLDPWWNVAVENQASDRAHRIGQTRNVEVIKLICRDSIEQRVVELQNIKKDLFDKLISNDDSSITKLKKEDIDFILK